MDNLVATNQTYRCSVYIQEHYPMELFNKIPIELQELVVTYKSNDDLVNMFVDLC